MTTKQIEYILELSQTLNFNHAAENLYVSQPTITYQIRLAEEEIGFSIFERSGKGAALTPAGAQFCTALRNIRDELKNAIEQGQNFSAKYREDIRIGLPMRSAIYYLPQAMTAFAEKYPSVSISPRFNALYDLEGFLRGEQDIVFAAAEIVRRIPDIRLHALFESRLYLITKWEDPLAGKPLIRMDDLRGHTLMVGGGSPRNLQILQQQIINTTGISYFNSPDHDTTLTNIAANKGICVAPGFLNDHSGEFAWIPFETDLTVSCVLCTHSEDGRKIVADFVKTLQGFYQRDDTVPV